VNVPATRVEVVRARWGDVANAGAVGCLCVT